MSARPDCARSLTAYLAGQLDPSRLLPSFTCKRRHWISADLIDCGCSPGLLLKPLQPWKQHKPVSQEEARCAAPGRIGVCPACTAALDQATPVEEGRTTQGNK